MLEFSVETQPRSSLGAIWPDISTSTSEAPVWIASMIYMHLHTFLTIPGVGRPFSRRPILEIHQERIASF